MMENEHGGILSKIIVIPAGVAVIVGVFVLGYYVGRNQGKQTSSSEKPPALPDVVSGYLPKKEDLTFYKTLTEKGEKSISIDLKPRPKEDASFQQESASTEQKEQGKKSAEKREKQNTQAADARNEKSSTEAPKRDPALSKAAPSNIRYTIQIGSYPERGLAEDEVKNMKKRGYAAFLVATNIPAKGMWYRVRVGSFSSRQAAEKLARDLKVKEGLEPFITIE